MIYDRIDKLEAYMGISGNLDAAFDYLSGNAPDSLSDGKHTIDGDNVFMFVSSYETRDADAVKFESHRKYIDIQIVLVGRESCFYAPIASLEVSKPFDAEGDAALYEDPIDGGCPVRLTPGVFALFFPHDGHKPGCNLDGINTVRKAVVKVAV